MPVEPEGSQLLAMKKGKVLYSIVLVVAQVRES